MKLFSQTISFTLHGLLFLSVPIKGYHYTIKGFTEYKSVLNRAYSRLKRDTNCHLILLCELKYCIENHIKNVYRKVLDSTRLFQFFCLKNFKIYNLNGSIY